MAGGWCCRRVGVHDEREKEESLSLSEKVGLFHDAHELLFVDFAVAIAISLVYHLLELFLGHSLAELACDSLEVLQ